MEMKGKSWGQEEIFEENVHFDFKRITIVLHQTWNISADVPRHRTFVCLSGIAKVACMINGNPSERYLKAGDMLTLAAGSVKTITAIDAEVVLIETSSAPLSEVRKTRKWV
jgi:mannose-6-phosphate isomerase-like protein (cupin superfamily)